MTPKALLYLFSIGTSYSVEFKDSFCNANQFMVQSYYSYLDVAFFGIWFNNKKHK